MKYGVWENKEGLVCLCETMKWATLASVSMNARGYDTKPFEYKESPNQNLPGPLSELFAGFGFEANEMTSLFPVMIPVDVDGNDVRKGW